MWGTERLRRYELHVLVSVLQRAGGKLLSFFSSFYVTSYTCVSLLSVFANTDFGKVKITLKKD